MDCRKHKYYVLSQLLSNFQIGKNPTWFKAKCEVLAMVCHSNISSVCLEAVHLTSLSC